jgi:hypothetical protein
MFQTGSAREQRLVSSLTGNANRQSECRERHRVFILKECVAAFCCFLLFFRWIDKVDVDYLQPPPIFLIGSHLNGRMSGFSPKRVSVMTGKIRNYDARNRLVECPKCLSHFTFRRALTPRFDAHGFESYGFRCKECRASLVAIIEPLDGVLLVSTV